MAIKIPDAVGIEALRAAVPRAMAARAARESSLSSKSLRVTGGAPGGALDFGGPHRVYVASVDDAIHREILKNARPAGWRYFVLRGDRAIATAQVTDPTNERSEFSNINYGVLAESTARAIDFAQTLDDVKKRDYELAVLEVPALYLVMLWLRSTASNLLIPLEPSPRGIEANRRYTQREMDGAAYKLAQQRIESHSRTAMATASARVSPGESLDIADQSTSTNRAAAPPLPKSSRSGSAKAAAKKK